MRTLHHTRTADGITIRLIERAEKPRFVIIQSSRTVGGFAPVGNDRDMAILTWIRCVELAESSVARRAG